ncbi:hypothetical protein N9P58_02130 [Puniceicoccaceae bacterium]|nr:hypothetical protein [Puniceicoccaceae bacterium]
MLNTPILFLIFNRPELTQRVFSQIAKAKPTKLFVAADGARNESEKVVCEQTRTIIDQIDWECEVFTLFRDKNLGCRNAVESAISWFFDNVEQGIILEDDCLPNNSFFSFCEEMLDRYQEDTRVMHIGGANFQNGIQRGEASYYFSRIMHCWGWASWRRAWHLNDPNLDTFKRFHNENLVVDLYDDVRIQNFLMKHLSAIYRGDLNTWCFVWFYSVLIQHGLCIIPNHNLISNIGFGVDSTHCADSNSPDANRPVVELENFNAPSMRLISTAGDTYTFDHHYQIRRQHPPLRTYIQRHPLFLFKKKFWNRYVFNRNNCREKTSPCARLYRVKTYDISKKDA